MFKVCLHLTYMEVTTILTVWNPSLSARCAEIKHWNLRVWSRERFMTGPSKENGSLVFKRLELPDGFLETVFIGKVWGEVCRVCDLPLIGWWWSNAMVFQESQLSALGSNQFGVHACVQLSPPRRRGPWFCRELRDMYQMVMHIPSGGTRTLPHYCSIVSWLPFLCFCIPSVLLLVTVWIFPLELRESPGG